jgi:hypothetical protein
MERLQDLEAVHARHLHVEEYERDQPVARQRLVVDDQRPKLLVAHAARPSGTSGSRRRTQVPCPGALVISGWCVGP